MCARNCCGIIILWVASVLLHENAAAQTVPLDEAIVRFQETWRVDLSYDAALLDGRQTAWITPVGTTPESDLQILLTDTGLVFRRLSSGTLSLAKSKSTGSISGRVVNDSTGAALSRVHIKLGILEVDAVTDNDGRFTISNVMPSEYQVRATHIGFAPKWEEVTVSAGDTVDLVLRMAEVSYMLEPTGIVAPGSNLRLPTSLVSGLTQSQFSNVGGLGTVDLIRSLDRVTGVKVHPLSGDIHIQGGDPGEHAFVLDGNPIFNPVHLHGLIGALNPFAVDEVEIAKAGFNASEGSYLAGVISSSHALPDSGLYYRDFHIDPLSFNTRLAVGSGDRFKVMGAVRKSVWNGGWSWMRSSAIDQLLLSWNAPDYFLQRASFYTVQSVFPQLYEVFLEQLDNIAPPALPDVDYLDIHLAGHIRFSGGQLLRGSFYDSASRVHGRRLIGSILEEDADTAAPELYDWENRASHVSWSEFLGSSVLWRTRARHSHYRLAHSYDGLSRQTALTVFGDRLFFNLEPVDDGNNVEEWAIKSTIDAEHSFGSLQAGLEIIRTSYQFVFPSIFPQTINLDNHAMRYVLYVQDTNRLAPGIKLTLGSRFTATVGSVYAEPRTSLEFSAGDIFNARIASGQYHQFLNRYEVTTLSPSTIVPYSRLWLPVDASIRPPMARHLAAEARLALPSGLNIRLEGYYKALLRLYRIDYPRLFQPDDGDTIFRDRELITDQNGFAEESHGRAYGFSSDLSYSFRRAKAGWQHTWSISEREYEFRGGDLRTEPVPWGVPHQSHIYAGFVPSPMVQLGLHWHGSWGRTWGFRTAYYDLLGMDVNQPLVLSGYDFRNPTARSHQLPAIRQMDLSVAVTTSIRSAKIIAQADLINVRNRRNVAHYVLAETDRGEAGSTVDRQNRYLLGRAFVFSLRVQL